MSEIGDDFKALREHSRAKKQANQKGSTDALESYGVAFTKHNGGVHLIVRHEGRTIDFWPSTGKWRERMDGTAEGSFLMTNAAKREGRGVFKLLKALGIKPHIQRDPPVQP